MFENYNISIDEELKKSNDNEFINLISQNFKNLQEALSVYKNNLTECVIDEVKRSAKKQKIK